jgi:hypothetical protein
MFVLGLYTGYFDMQERVLLKITTRKGSRVESVPLMKLKRLAKNSHRFWKLEGDFLILESY